MPREERGEASGCSIAPAARIARRGCSLPSSQERICEVPPRDRLGPAAGRRRDRPPHSTVWKVLAPPRPLAPAARDRARRPTATSGPAPATCCTWTSRATRASSGPATRVTGDRSQRARNWMAASTRVGYDYAHAIVDDHSRLAYVELHDDEKAATVTGFVERALAFFAAPRHQRRSG